MISREYTVKFNTPAFLGNADQTGQWRTLVNTLIKGYCAENYFLDGKSIVIHILMCIGAPTVKERLMNTEQV